MTHTPMTLGVDFSGEVVKVGKDVTHVKPGDEVYGVTPFRSGTFAEYTAPKSSELALKPKSLNHIQASTLPLPSMTSWQTLFETGKFKDGERILIHGVGGNVGALAAQFAKSRGAFVYGTDIPEKAGHVAGLGIDRFIDTSSERFEDVVKDVDLVLDYVGGEFIERSYTVLHSGGHYVTTLALETPQEEPQKRGFSSTGFGAQPRAELLAQIADLVDAGKIKVFVNRTFPLEETQAAMDYRYMSKLPGKVVITVL
jgi:NADPH:quinone reductase-like Zn-dependent oxidoreductase